MDIFDIRESAKLARYHYLTNIDLHIVKTILNEIKSIPAFWANASHG